MLDYANPWKRILAFALDYVLIFVYIALTLAVGFALFLEPLRPVREALFATALSTWLIQFLVMTLPVTLYFALCESSVWQGTLGKRKLGLRVVDAAGGRVGLARSLIRSAVKFLPWELGHTVFRRALYNPQPAWLVNGGIVLIWVLAGAYLASMLVSKKRQALYDLVAGTFVVAAPPFILTSGGE